MVKKSLSLFLCVIMIFSCFGILAPEAYAMNSVKGLFTIKGEPVSDGKIVYTLALTKDQKNVGGFIIRVDYDNNVLVPTDGCGPVERVTEDEGLVYNLEGSYVGGVNESNPGMYSIAYMNTTAVSTTQAISFYKMEFEVVDPTRPNTDVYFYCKEYFSTTEADLNVSASGVSPLIKADTNVATLEKPVPVGVEPCEDGLRFNWCAVEGAKGYEVFRMAEDTVWGKIAVVDGNVTSFADSMLESGKKYSYTVRAFNDYGVSLYDADGVSGEYIGKPDDISVENAVGGINVCWESAKGAENYYIYRRVAGEENWERIGEIAASSSTEYTDKDVVEGVTYEYDVNSVAGDFESAFSKSGKAVTYVKTPDVLRVANVIGGVEIQWAVNSYATHYEVYRKARGVDADFVKYGELTGTSFVDENVEPGKSYTYAVKACINNAESAYSSTGYTITCVAPAEKITLSPEKNGIIVTWDSVGNVDGYSIYRKSVNDGDWKKIGSVNGDVLSYFDTTVKSDNEYVYSVCSYVSTSESVKGEAVSIYYIASPTDVTAENTVDGIKITWSASAGAYSYEVFRYSENSDGVKLADIDCTDALEFVDKTTLWGERYTYSVKAISLKGESVLSERTVSTIRIGAMKVSSLEIAGGGIKVSWDAADGATGYAIYKLTDGMWLQIAEVNETYYVDKNVESAKAYCYAVAAIVNESKGILDVSDPLSISYIAPAKILSATNGSNYSQINWSAVDGAAFYELYRAEEGSKEFVLVESVGADTLSYIDYDVEPGKTYVYTIQSSDDENLSEASTEFRNTFLEIPQITSIANDFEGVTFGWKAVNGAEKYHVYRKIYGAKYWTYITTVDADTLSFTDSGATNGKLMCYTVKAVGAKGTSAYLAKCMTYVKAPVLSYSNSASGVYLKWDKNDSAVGYWVYRKAGNAKSWTRIAVVTTPYYTDTKVTSGTNYTYTVKTYSGQILSACNMDGWTVKYLSVPELVSATNGYGGVNVSWKKVPGAAAYYVYRKDNGTANWVCVGKTTAISYKDATVKNKGSYEYTVRAYYGSNVSYFKTKGVTTKYIEAPAMTVANRNGNVQLSWNAVSGATSYYVYRKAGSASSWKQIATVTTTSYTDKNVVNGTTYRYTIRTYSQKVLSGYNTAGWATVYLATPKLVSAISGTTGITVKWQSVKWATGYFVFRKTGNGSWVHIGTVNGTNSLTYIDRTAEKGVSYTYTVRAYYGNYRSWYQSGLKCTDKY